MAQMNNDLNMYRTALPTDDKKKKETPQDLRKRVAKKIFTEQEQRRTTDEPEGRLMRKVTKKKSTITKPISEQEQKQKLTHDKDKLYRPQGDETPKTNTNVLSTLNKKTKPSGYKISGNPADYTPEGSTEVNKKHKNRVNNILGKTK